MSDDKLTEAEMAELLDLMSSCTGIGINAPDVTISFDDIFTAGKFFDRLHRVLRRRWHERQDAEAAISEAVAKCVALAEDETLSPDETRRGLAEVLASLPAGVRARIV